MIIADLQHLARPITDLKPLPGNPRRGDVEAVMRSYDQFGQRKPIVARPDGTVIAGNHQLEAAKRLGWSEIAVVTVDDDDLTAKAYALADNRTGDLGTYNDEALAEMLADVAVDPDLLSATGYTELDLDELLAMAEPENLGIAGDPDDVPDTAPAKTIRGDIWQLGPHRLMCGDSTIPTDIDNLMAGKKADMIFTDPPYGMSYGGGRAKTNGHKKHEMIANDDLVENKLIVLVSDALNMAKANAKKTSALYVCLTWRTYSAFETAIHSTGAEIKACIVWDKQSVGLGNSHYRPQHEFIFYCDGEWNGDKSQSDVWQMSRGNTSGYVHPTQKPVELIAKAITNSSHPQNIILDPFGGSGSTLIAAHKLGRTAYLMELDEHYCDIICKRFQQATGITPVAASTGQPHSFID